MSLSASPNGSEPTTMPRSDSTVREAELVAKLQVQDLRAFEELYQHFKPRLIRFVVNMTRRPDLVEEVINDTMLAAWKGIPNFRGDSKLSTWIFSIAYRHACRAANRFDLPPEPVDTAEEVDPTGRADGNLESERRRRALQEVIAALSPDQRSVVELTYYHELSYQEIAQIMNCPVDTVKTRMFHARKKMKAGLAGDKTDWL